MNTNKLLFYILVYTCFFMIFSSCSTKKKSWVSRQYHNTTAKYNGYFNGKESIKFGVKKIRSSFEDDYSTTLPIFQTGDLIKAKATHPYMDKAIQKGSIVIQKHSINIKGKEYCRWIDDNYFMIGQAYFYKGEFDEAAKTFNFIIQEYKKTEISYEATLWLSRCFIEKEDFASAESILIELDNNRLFPKNLRLEYEIINADLYLRQKNNSLSRDALIKCVKKFKVGKNKARFNYIIGQIYQEEGNYKKAVVYYSEVLKSNAEYRMVFNTKMNLALCSDKDSKDSDKMRKQLVKMTKDDKNKEYLDQIYFTIAEMDILNSDTVLAKENYLKSTVFSIINDPQKALSFLALAKIEFVQSDFISSQLYYDSTIYFMPEDYRLYESAFKQYAILTDLVNNLNAIYMQDSLVALALLPRAELNIIIKNIIDEEIEKERIEKEKESLSLQNLSQGGRGGNRNEQFGNNTSGGKWYFYNPATLSFGLSEFRKKWGKRKLEDNWRRKNKKTTISLESDSLLVESEGSKNTKDPQFYLKQIPSTSEDFLLARQTTANACYQAAIIYKNDLLKIKKSTEMFTRILSIPDIDSSFLAMTYYNLYLNNNLQKNRLQSEKVKTILINNFKNSVYSKILSDSTYLNKMKLLSNKEDDVFAKTYDSFKFNNFNDVISETNSIKKNKLRDKYLAIRALSMLKSGDTTAFFKNIDNIVRSEDKDLSTYAKNIVEMIKDPSLINEANRQAIEKTPYLYEEESQHMLMFILPKKDLDVGYLKTLLSDYHQSSYSTEVFEISAMMMGLETHLVSVKFFENKNNALKYFNNISLSREVMSELGKVDYKILPISIGNFQEFYRNKDVDGYSNFVKEKYLNKN